MNQAVSSIWLLFWGLQCQGQFVLRGSIEIERISDDCVLNGEALGHAGIVYLTGNSTMRGSIYARCWNGTVECHVEEAVADKPDTEIVDCSEANNPRHDRRLQAMENQSWPQGVVCYEPLNDNVFSQNEQSVVQASFTEFKTKTAVSFMTIDECQQQPNAQDLCGNCQNYIEFIKDGNNCYSMLGYTATPAQQLSIGTVCFRAGEWIILHEIGHALGMYHEHAHPERNLVMIPSAIDPSTGAQNFQKVRSHNAVFRDYDVDSVMHYPLDARMCVPLGNAADYCDYGETENCIIATENDCDRNAPEALRAGPDQNGLSPGDVLAIAAVYGEASAISPNTVGTPSPSSIGQAPAIPILSQITLPPEETGGRLPGQPVTN